MVRDSKMLMGVLLLVTRSE